MILIENKEYLLEREALKEKKAKKERRPVVYVKHIGKVFLFRHSMGYLEALTEQQVKEYISEKKSA